MAALLVFSFVLTCWVYAGRQGMLSRGWTTAKLRHIQHDEGYAYIAPTHHAELSGEQDPSLGMVLENGVPLPGSTGAMHDEIRKVGRGRSSFWGGNVYFSPADNTSPLTNGRTYSIRYPRYVTDPFAYALYGSTILILAGSIWFAARTPAIRGLIRRMLPASPGPLFSVLLSVSVFSLILTYAAYSNRQGMPLFGWKTDALRSILPEAGFAFRASTRHPELSAEKKPSPGIVLENGSPLPAGDASHDEIRKLGNGSYSFWGRFVYFSASDNSAPDSNGRSYAIRYPRMVPSAVAFAIYGSTLLLIASSIWYASKAPELQRAIGRAAEFSLGSRFCRLKALSALLLGLSCATYANREGLFPLGWKTDVLANIHPENGFAFMAHTFHPELSAAEKPIAVVLENGRPLQGESGASHDEIRKLGAGRFSFWSDLVYFSASDNSAPGRNGRTYSILYPRTVGGTFALFVYASALLLLGLSIWRSGKIPDIPFYLPAGIVVFIFLITRLPFFLFYPVAGLSVDSDSYLSLVAALRHGDWPEFVTRTPGYPLFVWPFTFLPDRWMAVVYFQNILSLASALWLVYAAFRLRRLIALPAAVAMAAFMGGSQVLIYDTGILSESLYTSTTILAIAFLFLAFAGSARAYFSLASSFMALAILVRPAGIYFAAIYLLVLAFLLWNRYSTVVIFHFLTPFPAILLLFCSYNLFTIKEFVISPFGEANLAGATALYWEPDPSFPAFINNALDKLPASYEKAGITKEDFNTLRTSWDPDALMSLFEKQYNGLVWVAGWGSGRAFGTRGYLFYRKYIRDVSVRAIRKHPTLYAKYFWTNFVCFYFRNIVYRFDFYPALRERIRDEFITGTPEYLPIPGEWERAISSPPPAVQIVAGGSGEEVVLEQHYLTRLHIVWQAKQWRFFLRRFWVWGLFLTFALSVVQLLRFKGRHLGAFLLLVLSLVAIGAGLVIALVELAINRYSYPTQFVFYSSVAMAPLLWSNVGKRPLRGARPAMEPPLGSNTGNGGSDTCETS